MWKYNIDSNTWEVVYGQGSGSKSPNYVAPYPGGLQDHGMVMLMNDSILIFGGARGTNIYNDLWLFDTHTLLWELVASPNNLYNDYTKPYPGARDFFSMVSSYDVVYMFGGDGSVNNSSEGYKF